ncbi:MAG: hypothetical protein M0R31_04150 [Candidatus Riflebacteria bacterium]|nr:hypothetical protein [Candidatus Riflebacteria bacterium]
MIRNIQVLLVFTILSLAVPQQAEASIFSKALSKARNVMQSAFQMTFLNKLPVIFYKDSFDTMFEYANKSIENLNIQNDKKLHITKSAELALHLKSLFGSKYLAYGLTVLVGLIKEGIDSSFLNPNGSRSKEDLYADIVGAKAVFGKEKFDESLNKHIDSFVLEPQQKPQEESAQITAEPVQTTSESSYANESDTAQKAAAKQKLIQQYYEAARSGDSEAAKRIAEQLKQF